MAFTVTFPTSGCTAEAESVATWLTEQGESFEQESPGIFSLRALPVVIVLHPEDGLQAQIDVGSNTALSRLVDVLFDLSTLARADVNLAGSGTVSRPRLWMMLADEQDRLRIAEAIRRAATHGNQDEVLSRLWRLLSILRPDQDDRWDAQGERIVVMKEVGGEGLSLEAASWHADNPQPGDLVPLPVDSQSLHTLAWRWLSECYPGLAEIPHP